MDRNVDQRHQELRSLNGLPGDIDDRVLCDLIPIGYDASDVWCLPVSLRVKPSHERQPQDTAPQDGRTSQRAFDVGQKPPTRKGGKRGEKIASDQIPWLSWLLGRSSTTGALRARVAAPGRMHHSHIGAI